MKNADKQIARNTSIILDSLEEMADLIDSEEYEYDKEETEDQIRQIDAAIQYLKQATLIRRTEGMNLTKYPEKIMDGTPRPVVCIETNKVYGSMKEASDETGINSGNISLAVRGIIRTAGGYHWMAYIEERPAPINRRFQQPVICVETGELFKSIKEAGEMTGIISTSISAVINGRLQTAGGYHWEKAEEPKKEVVEAQKRDTMGVLRNMPKRKTNAKPVICLETGVIYESAAAAERETGIKRNLITSATLKEHGTAGGLHWEKSK